MFFQGVYLTFARGECISPRAGAKLSNTRSPGEASGPNVAIHHNKFFIFLYVYIQYIVLHISTQLAYCVNLMVMLSCIAIMKLLHQTIAVETSYVLHTPCPKQLHHRMHNFSPFQ